MYLYGEDVLTKPFQEVYIDTVKRNFSKSMGRAQMAARWIKGEEKKQSNGVDNTDLGAGEIQLETFSTSVQNPIIHTDFHN